MRKSNPYPRHRSFYAHAIPVASVGKLILVMIGFEIVFALTPFLVGFGEYGVDENGTSLVTPLQTLKEFGMFIVPCVALIVMIRTLHNRGFWSLIGPADQAWDDLKLTFRWVLIVLLLQLPFGLATEWDILTQSRPIDHWLLWLVPGMVVLLIQVSTEELFFRGYLQQFLAALNPSPWVWMVIPSTVFGLMHIINSPDPVEGLVWAYWAGLLGLACADLTARTGTLGAAIGLHLANNAVALFVFSTAGWPGSGLALYIYPFEGFDAPYGLIDAGEGAVIGALIWATASNWLIWMAARVAVRL